MKNAIMEDDHILTWRFMLRKYLEEDGVYGKKDSAQYRQLLYAAVENYFLNHLENGGYNIHIRRPDAGCANLIARRIEENDRIGNPSYAAEVFCWIKGFFGYVGSYLRWDSNPLDGVIPPRASLIGKNRNRRAS